MSKIEYRVEKTPCWPHEWFGGPMHNGNHVSNATCYYFRTEAEAQANVDKLKKATNAKR